jgi:hypothetical protein
MLPMKWYSLKVTGDQTGGARRARDFHRISIGIAEMGFDREPDCTLIDIARTSNAEATTGNP